MINAMILRSLLSTSASRSGKDYSNIDLAVDCFVSAANRLVADTPVHSPLDECVRGSVGLSESAINEEHTSKLRKLLRDRKCRV